MVAVEVEEPEEAAGERPRMASLGRAAERERENEGTKENQSRRERRRKRTNGKPIELSL